MIEVYGPQNNLEAYLLQGLLAQHGVESQLQGEYLQGGMGELPMAGNVSLMVAPEQAGKARELLAQYERGELATDEGDLPDEFSG